MKSIKLAISLALLATAIGVVAWNFDLSEALASARNLSLFGLAAVFLALVVNALTAALRFKIIASDVGHHVDFRKAVAAVSVGGLGGAAFFQLAGQLMARGAMMNRGGIPFASVVVITLYERAVAAIVSGLLALAGAYFIFGHIYLDQAAGGGDFIKIIIGLIAATCAGALLGYGRRASRSVSPKMNVQFASRLLRAIALSLLVQLPMMAAYVAVAHMLSPFTPLTDLAAAAALVMFAASVPISLAGWGIREMSAVFALGAIGVGTGKALAAAIIIGVGSLLSMAALSALSITSWHSGSVQTEETKPASVDYLVLLAWSLPVAAATLVLFQLYLPIASGTFLNVNLSDPIVLLGGSFFLLQAITHRQPPRWRMPNLNVVILAMTLVLAISLIIGVTRFGYTEWAVINKFLGWFVLLAYALTGALLVKTARQDGFKTLLLTFAAATAAVVALEFILVVLKSGGLHFLLPVTENEIQGFAQNRNAFAFQILMAMAAATVVLRNQRLRVLFMATFMTGLWFCGSRSGWGAELVLIVAALYLRTATPREIAMAVVLAAFMIVIPLLLSLAHHGHPQLPVLVPEFSATHERVNSIRGGWEMFLQHPIFGAGLGAFKNLMIPSGDNQSLVIHSTPIWFMAETGLVGLFVFAVPALYILISEFFRKHHDMASHLLVLTLVAFVVMAIPADMFYQRTFWLLIGAGLAAPYKPNMEVNSA